MAGCRAAAGVSKLTSVPSGTAAPLLSTTRAVSVTPRGPSGRATARPARSAMALGAPARTRIRADARTTRPDGPFAFAVTLSR